MGKSYSKSFVDESEYVDESLVKKIENNVPFMKEYPTSDSIVNSVIRVFISRSNVGLEKYGTTLDREDLSLLDWVQHAQEELMDGILYLERIKTCQKMLRPVVNNMERTDV